MKRNDPRKRVPLGLDGSVVRADLMELVERRGHEASKLTPGIWLLNARNLIRAAEHLYAPIVASHDRDAQRMLDEVRAGGFKEGSRTRQGEELDDHLNFQMQSVWAMLVGMSFECLLKGALLAHDHSLTAPENYGHSLLHMADTLGATLSARERELLGVLTDAIEWRGRYPVPKEPLGPIASEAEPTKAAPGLNIKSKVFKRADGGPEDKDILDALWSRLYLDSHAKRTSRDPDLHQRWESWTDKFKAAP